MMSPRLLASYLNDHLAAEVAAVALFERTTEGFAGTDLHDELRELTAEATGDRDWLRAAMDTLGVGASRTKQLAALAAERVGRLKPNGRLFVRTALTDLVELEGLRIAVAAKINGLQVLRALAVQDARLDKAGIEALLERAQSQADRLYRLHLQVARELTTAA